MKIMIGSAHNLTLKPMTKGVIETVIEIIVIVSEPAYNYGSSGISKSTTVSDMRFYTNSKGLRELAAQFLELADTAEKLIDAVQLKESEAGQ